LKNNYGDGSGAQHKGWSGVADGNPPSLILVVVVVITIIIIKYCHHHYNTKLRRKHF